MSTFDFWQVNCNVRGSSSSMKKQRFRHVNNWRAQPQCDSRGRSANRQTEAESVGPQTGAASGTHKTQINKWKAWLPFAFTFDFFQSYFISGTLFACLPHQFQFYWQAAQRNQLRRLLKYPVSVTFQLSETFYPPEMRYKISHPVTRKYARYTSPFHLGFILSCRPHRRRSFNILQVALLFALVPFTRTATQPTALARSHFDCIICISQRFNYAQLLKLKSPGALCRVLVPRHKQLITHLICADIWGPKTTRPQWQADWTRWCAALAAH